VSIMTNPKSAPAARVSAANALLDRGYGKPPQHITGPEIMRRTKLSKASVYRAFGGATQAPAG
jgi:hypothetical protein